MPLTSHLARTAFHTVTDSEFQLAELLPRAAPPAALRTHTTQAATPIPCPQQRPPVPSPGAQPVLRPQPHWRPLAAMCPRTVTRSSFRQHWEPSATWAATSFATRGTTTGTCPYSRTSGSPSVSAPNCGGRFSTCLIFPSPPIPLAHPAS